MMNSEIEKDITFLQKKSLIFSSLEYKNILPGQEIVIHVFTTSIRILEYSCKVYYKVDDSGHVISGDTLTPPKSVQIEKNPGIHVSFLSYDTATDKFIDLIPLGADDLKFMPEKNYGKTWTAQRLVL